MFSFFHHLKSLLQLVHFYKATRTCSEKLSERPLRSLLARTLAKFGIHLEDLATDNLDRGCLGFSLSSSKF
jgi:hypothetical protein